jgi:CRP/FNR family cyclic AMP-dependent transcriptional regulator
MLEPVTIVSLFQKQPNPLTFSAGEIIFEEGQAGDAMYGVIEGEVEMRVNGKIVETIEPGDVFGERALVQPDHIRASTAIAKTDCKLAFLDRERFLFAVQQTPLFALEVIRSYSNRLSRLKHLL